VSDPTANQPVTEPAAAPPPADPAAAGAPPAEPTTYDQAYVERLNREAAEWRTKAQTYEEAFAGYGEDDRETVLALARALQTSPLEAAELMEQAVRAIRGEESIEPAAPAPTPAAAPAADDVPITKAQLEEFLAAREAAAQASAAEQQMIAAVQQEVRDAGYDPADSWGLRVMQLAAFQTGGDIKAAVALVDAEKQKIIDDYVAAKAADGGITTPAVGGGIPSGEKTIKTLEDAANAMKERLARVQ